MFIWVRCDHSTSVSGLLMGLPHLEGAKQSGLCG